jgi:pimeloyl-[acyl-carrier protein] methyl ester esterase
MSSESSLLNKSTDPINIVFLHGWGMNSGVFDMLIEVMLKKFANEEVGKRVSFMNLDLPGHGDKVDQLPPNSSSALDWDLDTMAAAVEQQLPSNCILIGWSLGGLIAQRLAISACTKLVGLVTIASTPKFQMSESWPGIKPEVLSLFTQQLAVNHQKTLSRFLAIQMMGVSNAKALIKAISVAIDAKPAPHKDALAAGLSILQTADLRIELNRIMVPTLRLYGRLDSLVPHEAIELVQGLQPKSQQFTFNHASHAPFITDPSGFADTLINALNLKLVL